MLMISHLLPAAVIAVLRNLVLPDEQKYWTSARFYELGLSRYESGHPDNSFYLQSFIALTQSHDQMPEAWYNLVTIRPRSSARIEQSPPESILGTRVGNALCESAQTR